MSKWDSKERLAKDLSLLFEDYNDTFSTYSSNSLITQFNLSKSEHPFEVTNSFMKVAQFGKRLYYQSGGLWDASIQPLYNLWRFNSSNPIKPSKESISLALDKVGYDSLLILDNKLVKNKDGFSLDFSSIAKGDCVDKIKELLLSKGFTQFFIDIGGEIVVNGNKPNGKPWKLGIRDPLNSQLYFTILALTEGALATSGDYQQFFILDNVTYSHIINPKTGYPIKKRIASVSVFGPNCMEADGYATALMLMSPKEGLNLIEQLDGFEALILEYSAENTLIDHYSSGFKKLIY